VVRKEAVMPYKNPDEQRAYLQQWRRQRQLDRLSAAERQLREDAERVVALALRCNEFVQLRKAVQECAKLLQRLVEAR
jgi:hypothetical protein